MSALEPIYSAYYKPMCNQALWVVHNKQDAEDVASEAIIKLVKYATGGGAYVKDGGAFIYTLVKNTALDFVRKQKHAVSLSDEVADTLSDGGDGNGELDKIAIHEAMKSLSEVDFKIAELFYYYDCKIKTVATETGMTVSAVKWHLSEIRKKLYEILKNS